MDEHSTSPAEVIVDPALSKEDKVRALEGLEQDARQLAAASAEGMSGGERTELQEVLVAKNALELPPFDLAVSAVLQGLRARLHKTEGTEARGRLTRAIDAIEAVESVGT